MHNTTFYVEVFGGSQYHSLLVIKWFSPSNIDIVFIDQIFTAQQPIILLRDALKKITGLFGNFFADPPPPLLGTPYSKKKKLRLFSIVDP